MVLNGVLSYWYVPYISFYSLYLYIYCFLQHKYVSLSEIQIRQEEEMTRNPLSHPENDVPQTPAEILYQVGV